MQLDHLKRDIIITQKKGLPFICASVMIWGLIAIIASLDIDIQLKNILVFVCSTPLMLFAWLFGKVLKVDIFKNENPLGKLGFIFTLNQMIYLLIVMWVFNAVPEKMIMVYSMVFGAHLLPYSWLYDSKIYAIFSVTIPVIALVLGNLYSINILPIAMVVIEIIFVIVLFLEMKQE
ncbi:DUF7010 family protein [Macrococcus animalis]|uniref:DUF7010 family protein n=1 Tax=Macrococcus animalis TaxID=3395467 RepID=UPI0039BE2188